ncbi:MAG TPA: 1-acyl-sn-glycerol-3-phosphate acyltransferase, partial [Candidatus Bathyarchaeia archaeon]|nr:1-acyl-sn-glycerol-3-phosphate acyltransferase [Candidatus Bathyarchaeia archaeon]
LGQYFLRRLGLRHQPPEVKKYYVHGLHGLDAMFGWTRKVRIRGAEHVPRKGPTIFASNHIQIDDPFVTGALIHELSGGIRPAAMMRDDFFKGIPRWMRGVLDPDEVCRLIGAAQISRHGVTEEQIDQFVGLLLQGETFLIYPGRSRSQMGLIFEYRDWIRSPGRTSLFPSLVHMRDPGLDVPVVPVTRTYNPLTKRSCVAFGQGLYLERGASPAGQREFDYGLVRAIADLVEVNAPQLLSALLYLRCLHGLSLRAGVDELADALRDIIAAVAERNPARMLDPALVESPEREAERLMRFLRKRSLVQRNGDRFELNCQAILSIPTSNAKYKAQNPVKYLANQLIHLRDVMGPVEERLLGHSGPWRSIRPALAAGAC